MGRDSDSHQSIVLALHSGIEDDHSEQLSERIGKPIRVISPLERVLDDLSHPQECDCLVAVGTDDEQTIAALESIRSTFPYLPIVFYPQTGSEALASRASEIGVTEYVHAGGGVDHLVARIRQATAQSSPERSIRERIKELNAIQETVDLLEREREAPESLFDEFVELLPPAFQAPAQTAARLSCGEVTAQTDSFEPRSETLTAASSTVDGRQIWLEVVRLDEASVTEDPFIPEERELLDTLVTLLAGALERAAYYRDLEESEERFRQLAENIEEVVWMSDVGKDSMLYVNPAYETVWDRPVDELYELPTSFLESVHPADRDRVRRAITEQAAGDYDEEYRILRPDGTVRWIHDRAVPIENDGEVTRIVGVATDVTGYKRARAELEEHVGRMTDAFYALDADWRFTYLNETAETLLDRDAEALLDSKIWDELPSVQNTELESAFRKAVDTQTPVSFEYHDYEPGTVYEINAYPSETGLSVYFRDVTTINEQERRYGTLVENLPGIVYRSHVDETWPFEFVHGNCKAITGYTADELLEDVRWGEEVLHPGDREWSYQAVREAIDRDEPFELEYRILTPAGETRWLWERGQAVAEGVIEGFISDVTERKHYEEELERTSDLLTNAERLGDVGAWEYRADSETVYWTDGARRIFDVPDDFETTVESTLSLFHEADQEQVRESLAQCLESGDSYDLKVRIQRASGVEGWVQLRGEALSTEEEPEIVRGYVQDITEQVETKQQLSVLDRVLRHNLRNDMNVILANAELIADKTDGEVHEHLEKIFTRGEALLSLSKKHRDVAAVLSEPASQQSVDLEAMARRTVDRCRERYSDAEITASISDSVSARAMGEIELAIEELVENAIVHNDSPSPRVSVSVETTNGVATISVEDNGPGLPGQERSILRGEIEEPLAHASGIGLWLVRWIVARSGGTLAFEENRPRGCVVRISLQRE